LSRKILQHHRQRIGLFSRGACRTPDLHCLVAARFEKSGQHSINKKIEVMLLTEEVSLIGSYHIDHMDQFIFDPIFTVDKLKVVLKSSHVKRAQPPVQPAFNHRLFTKFKVYATV
jgi:hypothetical protein